MNNSILYPNGLHQLGMYGEPWLHSRRENAWDGFFLHQGGDIGIGFPFSVGFFPPDYEDAYECAYARTQIFLKDMKGVTVDDYLFPAATLNGIIITPANKAGAFVTPATGPPQSS